MNPYLPETEEFGIPEPWRLITRTVVDGQRMTIRALPIEGRGVLLQISRQDQVGEDEWGPMRHEEPALIDNVMVVEVMEREQSQISDAQGNTESKFRPIHRQLMGVSVARENFMPKGKQQKKGEKQLNIRAGVVLAQERAPMVAPANLQETMP